MEWVRVWSFQVWFDSAAHSPWNAVYFQTDLTTAGGVRQWRERALANRDVVNYRVTPVRKLVGEQRTHCPSGHEYHTGFSTIFGRHEWAVCPCGGHHVLHCDATACRTPWTYEPPLSVGCVARDTDRYG